MTKLQKALSVCLSLCLFLVLAAAPKQLFYGGNVYRQLPLYCFLEERAERLPFQEDQETYEKIVAVNGKYLGQIVRKERLAAELEKENRTKVTEGAATESERLRKGSVDHTESDGNRKNVDGKGEITEDLPTDSENKASFQDEENTRKSAKDEEEESTFAENSKDERMKRDSLETAELPHPVIDLSPEMLANPDYLLNQFFIEDAATKAAPGLLNADCFLEKDLSIKKSASEPQILIYHSHSTETFADSRSGKENDTIVGVGTFLTKILTETYGYNVIHIKEAFDMAGGTLDRSSAYDYAREYLVPFLEEHPSIEVIIDMHRDGVPEDRHLVTEIDGKRTAQIMFYNGLSYTLEQGDLGYLPNPYIEDNLAFSFQMEYLSARYYPDFYRGIYLAAYRYNLHLRPRSMLLEVGAQNNTVQEAKNAMTPFAELLHQVLEKN